MTPFLGLGIEIFGSMDHAARVDAHKQPTTQTILDHLSIARGHP